MTYALTLSPKFEWFNSEKTKPPIALIVLGSVDQKIIKCYFDVRDNSWRDLRDRQIEVLKWRKIIYFDGKES